MLEKRVFVKENFALFHVFVTEECSTMAELENAKVLPFCFFISGIYRNTE